jgi:tetratricopeptide (TPR) repeat protein
MRPSTSRRFVRRSSFVTAIAVAWAVLAPTPVLARHSAPAGEPSPAEAERLRDLYARGQAAFDAGSYTTAIETFEEAYSIGGDPTLLFNISLCHDRLGDYDTALEYLDRYAEKAPEAEQADIARRRASLEARQERAQRQGAASEQPSTVEPEPATTPAHSRDAEHDDRLMTPAAWVFTGIGVAAFGTGIGLGAASLARAAGAECENRAGNTLCTERGADDAKASRNLALGADIAIGIGALAAIGVIAIVGARAAKRNKSSRRSGAAARRVALTPGFGGGALIGRF